MTIEKYKKSESVAIITEQIREIKTTYDLVRMKNYEIACEENKNIIADMIMNINEFASISRKMGVAQIAETVNMLLEEFTNMTLQEYQFFFKKVKTGQFGQLYESLDGIKIMAFLHEFYAELLKSYKEMKMEPEYQRKIDQGCRDIDTWVNY